MCQPILFDSRKSAIEVKMKVREVNFQDDYIYFICAVIKFNFTLANQNTQKIISYIIPLHFASV